MTDDTESTSDREPGAGAGIDTPTEPPRTGLAPVTALFGQRRSDVSGLSDGARPVDEADEFDSPPRRSLETPESATGAQQFEEMSPDDALESSDTDEPPVTTETPIAPVTRLAAWADENHRTGPAEDHEHGADDAPRSKRARQWAPHAPRIALVDDEADADRTFDGNDDDTHDATGPTRDEAMAAAEQRLLRRLRRGDRSGEELRRALRTDEDLDEAAIEEILARLESLGYIDDLRMAEMLADKLFDRRGKGIEAVRRELRGRLLDDEAIEHAIQGRERDDEHARAADLAESRAERLRGLDRDTALRRLVGFLQRRGFASGVAFIAANEALDGVDAPSRRTPTRSSKPDTSGVFFGNTTDD